MDWIASLSYLAYTVGAIICGLAAIWIARRGDATRGDRVPAVVAVALTANWCFAAASFEPGRAIVELTEIARNLAWLFMLFRLFGNDGRDETLRVVRPAIVSLAFVEVLQFALLVIARRYAVTPDDRLSQTFELTFDLSVFDLFLAWECGARVCIPSHAQKMLPSKYIQESEITIWFSVPSTAILMNKLRMLKSGLYPSLRWSLFCGEALPAEILEQFLEAAPHSTAENLYGPTELTIACTLYRWHPSRSRDECELGIVPIGDPYPGMEVLVADEDLQPVAEGETGELLMTGPQLTPGYWRDPDKTAAAYVTPPGQDRVFYRTGDRVRRSRGKAPMVYLGRMDNQIKIRGYRVELGEIEACVRDEAGVDVAISVGWPITAAGADSNVVFVSDESIDLDALLKRVKTRLPGYMAPSEIRRVDTFPLNSNDKVDRKALLATLEAAEQDD